MYFLGNQNHKITTQNWFLTKANLQESINKNTQMISKDGIYDFFYHRTWKLALSTKPSETLERKTPIGPKALQG